MIGGGIEVNIDSCRALCMSSARSFELEVEIGLESGLASYREWLCPLH